jgi:hypothetical protein
MQCSKCKLEKSPDCFSFKDIDKNARHKTCRECHRAYTKDHYLKNKEKYIAKAKASNPANRLRVRSEMIAYLKSHPCVDCGNSDIRVLQFDHIEPLSDGKARRVGNYTHSFKAFRSEVNKCEVRCANCHMIKTFSQLGWGSRT